MMYLDSNVVRAGLTLDIALDLAKDAFKIKAAGDLCQPVRSIVDAGEFGLMGTMPVYISKGAYKGFGVKSVAVKFSPSTSGKPSHNGAVLIYNEDGSEFSIVDATAITEIRTAAASALATDILAKPQSKCLAILGTGMQAKAHLQAMCNIRPIQSVRVWSRDIHKAETFSSVNAKAQNITIEPCKDIADAINGAEIICTTTAARETIVFNRDIGSDVHINAIGASAIGFRELDESLFKRAQLYTDCNDAVMAGSQAVIDAVKSGYLDSEEVGTEIGTLIDSHWKRPNSCVTVFKSVGLAVQDIVAARYLLAQHAKGYLQN